MDLQQEYSKLKNLSDRDLKKHVRRLKTEREALSMQASLSGGGYTGANSSRRFSKTWNVASGTPDELILDDRQELQDKAEDLYRNNSIARGIIENKTENTVGASFKLQSVIDHDVLGISDDYREEWQMNVERKWRNFASTTACDAERKHNFSQKIEIAMRTYQMLGEVFALYPRFIRKGETVKSRVKLQLMPPRRCQNPYQPNSDLIRDGIEISPRGEPVNYWFLRQEGYRSLFGSAEDYVAIPAYGAKTGRRNVVHIYRTEFIGQNRGVPFLSCIIEDLKQIDRGGKNELTNMAVTSLFSAFIETERDIFQNPFEGTKEEIQTDETDLVLDAGLIQRLKPGEKITFANPGRPNSNVIEFIKQYLVLISMGVGIPYEAMMRQFMSSYSASKAARIEANKHYMTERNRIVPIASNLYTEWLIDMVASGEIEAPGFFENPELQAAWSNHIWIGEGMRQINEVEETTAAMMRVNQGFSNRTAEAAAMGFDFEKNIEIAKRENKLMQDAGLDYSAQTRPEAVIESESIDSEKKTREESENETLGGP